MSEDPQEQQAPEDAPEQEQQDAPSEPDEDAGPAVEPAEGDQGEYVEQAPAPADSTAGGFDPDRPVRTSAPTPEQQSGVPQPTDGSNEGVEANEEYRGPYEPSKPGAEEQGEPHGDDSGAEPTPESAEGEPQQQPA